MVVILAHKRTKFYVGKERIHMTGNMMMEMGMMGMCMCQDF